MKAIVYNSIEQIKHTDTHPHTNLKEKFHRQHQSEKSNTICNLGCALKYKMGLCKDLGKAEG